MVDPREYCEYCGAGFFIGRVPVTFETPISGDALVCCNEECPFYKEPR